MEEFYKFMATQYHIILYVVVWFAAIVHYRNYFDTPLKYFPVYLMYTFLTELLGYFISFHDSFQFFSDERYNWHNVIIFNIYSVITFPFFYYIYWRVLKNEKHRKWVKHGTVISMSVYVISLFFQDPFHMNLYYADLVASMVLLTIIGLYFKEKKERRIFPLSFERQPYVLDKFGIGRLSHILSLSVLDRLRGPRNLGGIPAASSVESIDPVYVRNLYAWIYHLKKESLQVVL